MLDLAFVRANLSLVEDKLRQRGTDPALLKNFTTLDAERRSAITELETLKARRNALSQEFGKLKRTGRYPAGRRPSWKKAVVTLSDDSKSIEFFEGMA